MESCDSDTEQSLEEYQRDLRERANRSIQQLKDALEDTSSTVERGSTAHTKPVVTAMEQGCGTNQALQELQHSHAVNQLKALLREQESKANEEFSPRRLRKPPTGIPTYAEENNMVTLNNIVPIVHDQSQYIQRLEAEVKFCKEEMLEVKQRIRVVVHENDELHQLLKSKILEQTAKEQAVFDASENLNEVLVHGKDQSHGHQEDTNQTQLNVLRQPVMASSEREASELHKWQLELERLKLLYDARTETLEAQTVSLRKDLSEAQKNCEDLRGRLRHQESLLAASSNNRAGGLCLKCAQHEAVLAQTHNNVHVQAIERVTKERDELMSALVVLRKNLKDMQHRECKAYEQVKQAVVMTEEANLEKTIALIQCEQLKSELERKKERLEREVAVQQEKMANEKQNVRDEMSKEREELSSKMTTLLQNVAERDALLERLTREKKSIASQLEEALKQLSSKDIEVTEVSAEMRYQLNQAKLRKDEAEKEFREHRAKMMRELELKDQEIEKLGFELSDNKQRLEHVQQDATGAKDECLRLTELLGKSERQLHLTRLERDGIQQSLSSDARALASQAQQREQELTQKMQQMAAQHGSTVNEIDSLLTSQNALIAKLKDECRTLAVKLEEVAEKNRLEVGKLSQENEYMNTKIVKLQKRNDELEEQCIQHGRMHERMKQRLQQLDKHCQNSSHQLVELLNKQNQLIKDKQILDEENRTLKTQLPHIGTKPENQPA
ncbi:serologically defined colon cancer antigen 8 isoform X2 [Pleurodeles waltl]|uniref:serologically defined colon cancer antigen 8 isoform X2 n=1 Tax=Pleurodeles waltl TaxID=8319 RepID=UPI0037095A61